MNTTALPLAPAPLRAQTRIDTPLGPLLLATTDHGLAGAWFDAQTHHPGESDAVHRDDHPVLRSAARVFATYWSEGAVAAERAMAGLPLDPQGTAFQQAVWQQLLTIAAGQTTHYGAIAQRLGRPDAARAVGAAVGRNPIAILVPCHRVLGRGGSLTGYAAGLPRKRALLAHEGLPQPMPTADLFDTAAGSS
jgi:methylated-DNA-[protein]-cysteine S-methyltransferase